MINPIQCPEDTQDMINSTTLSIHDQPEQTTPETEVVKHTFQHFLQKQYQHIRNKEITLEMYQNKIMECPDPNLTFNPKINRTSKQLMKRCPSKEAVHERLYKKCPDKLDSIDISKPITPIRKLSGAPKCYYKKPDIVELPKNELKCYRTPNNSLTILINKFKREYIKIIDDLNLSSKNIQETDFYYILNGLNLIKTIENCPQEVLDVWNILKSNPSSANIVESMVYNILLALLFNQESHETINSISEQKLLSLKLKFQCLWMNRISATKVASIPTKASISNTEKSFCFQDFIQRQLLYKKHNKQASECTPTPHRRGNKADSSRIKALSACKIKADIQNNDIEYNRNKNECTFTPKINKNKMTIAKRNENIKGVEESIERNRSAYTYRNLVSNILCLRSENLRHKNEEAICAHIKIGKIEETLYFYSDEIPEKIAEKFGKLHNLKKESIDTLSAQIKERIGKVIMQ